MEKTGETVHLVQVDGNYAFYIDKVDPIAILFAWYLRLENVYQLYCSAVGKAVLAEDGRWPILHIWETSDMPYDSTYNH